VALGQRVSSPPPGDTRCTGSGSEKRSNQVPHQRSEAPGQAHCADDKGPLEFTMHPSDGESRLLFQCGDGKVAHQDSTNDTMSTQPILAFVNPFWLSSTHSGFRQPILAFALTLDHNFTGKLQVSPLLYYLFLNHNSTEHTSAYRWCGQLPGGTGNTFLGARTLTKKYTTRRTLRAKFTAGTSVGTAGGDAGTDGRIIRAGTSLASAVSATTCSHTKKIRKISNEAFRNLLGDTFESDDMSTVISSYSKYISPLSSARRPSPIRKLMPLLKRPGMISLGGGLPNPFFFPVSNLAFRVKDPGGTSTANVSVSQSELDVALQYSPTSGIPELRSQLLELQQREHCKGLVDGDGIDLILTVGSQDGLCKAFEMLIDPKEDFVFVETPTYTGALAFLKPFGAKLIPVETDEHGIIPSKLEAALESTLRGPISNQRRVLYTVPTAGNPSGATLSRERRHQVLELAAKFDLIILEDDPYYFLHPRRDEVESLFSLDTDGRVMRFDSVSKIISSGMRVGFATGPAPLVERLNYHVQATNLHNSGVSQLILSKVLQHWGVSGFNAHVQSAADFYCERRDVLVRAAERHLVGLAEWHSPEAGMFLWMKLIGIDDTKALIEEKAADANVLLVPGQAFCPLDSDASPSSYVRASFSLASDDEMDTAMERLAKLIVAEKTAT